MKKRNLLFIAMLCLIIACTKKEATINTFTVSSNKTTYKVGDTVLFSFTGNPDFITFYSGESGFNYDNVNRAVLNGKTQLQFSTYKQNGAQLNSLQVLVSNDFMGTNSILGIKAGTWTDITNRATLSTGTDNTASGVIDISDLVKPYKQSYLAFRKMDANSPTLKPNQWTVRSFNVDVLLPDNTLYPVANLTNAGWAAVDSLNASYKWVISTSTLVAAGGNLNTAANEDWVITKALTPLNVTPDPGIPVKWLDAKHTDGYSYVYKAAGTYTMVFVASDQNIYGQNPVIVKIPVTITP